MRVRWRLWLPGLAASVATFAVFAVPPAAGQSGVPLDMQDVDTGSRPGVAFTVTAPRELVGVDLGEDHFSVFENGTKRAVRVSRVSSDALEVVLVIDTSGSMQGAPMAAAKGAAIDFISSMPRGTRVGVVGFGTEPKVARPLSTDTEALIAAVQGLDATGETALYDAVITVTEELAAEANPDARRVVIVLSDGGDTASVRTLDEAVGLIGGVKTGFYAVALATAESDLGALGRMATATGGRVVAASEPSEIAAVYEDIASQLVNQYRLSYRSDTEGTATIQVTLAAEGITATVAEQVDLGFIAETESPRADAPSAPAAYTAPGPSFLAARWTLLAGVIPMGMALFVVGWLTTSHREPKRRRLARELGSALGGEARSVFTGMTDRATAFADRMLSQNDERAGRLNAKLEQAGLAVRPGEFIVFSLAVVAGGTGVVLLMLGPAMAVGAVTVLGIGIWQGLNHMQRRRQRALADQLGDTLQLLAGSLRAGHGLIQALDQVTREAESPTAEEFHRVIVEARLGRDLSDALSAMAKRAGNEDVEWVVQAIRIHREVGGDLSEILDRVGETIRDRNRVRGQIRSLTAEGRLSGIILMALPFLVGGWMYLTNRPYIMELFTRPAGRVILAVGAVLMTMGAAVMKRLVKPEF
ncbi:MAG TPA: type II secretion system F family protein [Acidimicrobiia bacterium]|nr:type II secretion system F family protein [Acidimicrobiia bacterium]